MESEHTINVETLDGGDLATDLGYGIKVNDKSTMRRSWVVLNDPLCPVRLSKVGITTEYRQERYRLRAAGEAIPLDSLSAFETRFVLYDTFGDHLKTLSLSEIQDHPTGHAVKLSDVGSWSAFNNEETYLLSVVSFVARARTAHGSVWRYREEAISECLERIRLKVAVGALEVSKQT